MLLSLRRWRAPSSFGEAQGSRFSSRQAGTEYAVLNPRFNTLFIHVVSSGPLPDYTYPGMARIEFFYLSLSCINMRNCLSAREFGHNVQSLYFKGLRCEAVETPQQSVLEFAV